MYLSNEPKFLAVAEAVDLITQHIIDCCEPPSFNIDDGWYMVWTSRPEPQLALTVKVGLWTARVRAAARNGDIRICDADGFRIEFDPVMFQSTYVAPADLAHWLISAYGKIVFLNGVRQKPTLISVAGNRPAQDKFPRRGVKLRRLWSV
jgi:hypothetical protein